MGLSIGIRFFAKTGMVENFILGVALFACIIGLIWLTSLSDPTQKSEARAAFKNLSEKEPNKRILP